MPQTQGAYKQWKFVSHGSGGEKSESRLPAGPGEGPLLGTLPLSGEGAGALSGPHYIKAHFMGRGALPS